METIKYDTRKVDDEIDDSVHKCVVDKVSDDVEYAIWLTINNLFLNGGKSLTRKRFGEIVDEK